MQQGNLTINNSNNNNNLNIFQNQGVIKSVGKPGIVNVHGGNQEKNALPVNQVSNNGNSNQQSIVNQIKLDKDVKANNTTSKFQNLTINTGNSLNTGNTTLNADKKLPLTTKNEANKPKIFQNIQVNLKNTSPKNITTKKPEKIELKK